MIVMTYVAVALLAVGVVLMVVNGISPLVGGAAFDPIVLLEEIAGRRPDRLPVAGPRRRDRHAHRPGRRLVRRIRP